MAADLEQRVREAFREKLLLLKIPAGEKDFLPSSCCLLVKQKELAEMEKTLSAKKEEFLNKMKQLEHRRQELKDKENMLKEAIVKFDKILKENEAKRKRAVLKADHERQQITRIGAEAEYLREEIIRLLMVRDKLQQRLAAHEAFPEYLQKVLEKMKEVPDTHNLIGRFQTLLTTRDNLIQRELVAREAVEQEHQKLQKLMDTSHNQILQQNNYVSELRAKLKQVEDKVLKLESKWNCIQNTAANKTLELGQIKLAAVNLYQMVANHRKLPVQIRPEDTKAQLDAVQLFFGDLTGIIADFRRRELLPNPLSETLMASKSSPAVIQSVPRSGRRQGHHKSLM